MECYLDNSATTRVSDDVAALIADIMKKDFGNPSSKHMKGVESDRLLRHARETFSSILKVNEKDIYFTSGGTESNNLAIIGSALANKRAGMHIITTQMEHASVLEPMKYLKEQGFDITYLSVDGQGHIDLQELERAIRPDTILVSVMYVNNEIGAVQDISSIGGLIKKKNPKTVFHCDAVQAFGKYNIYPAKEKIDLLSISGHKIHGPKGVGVLYINSGIKLRPLILGGGQQRGMRSGTDNVPGACGMALAAQDAYDRLEENNRHMAELKDHMTDALTELADDLEHKDGNIKIRINSLKGMESAPHIISCTFLPVKSEVLLHTLEERHIYVSSGSACSSHKRGGSDTLAAIGLTSGEADCTVRFSLCDESTIEEIDYCLDALRKCIPHLARFVSG